MEQFSTVDFFEKNKGVLGDDPGWAVLILPRVVDDFGNLIGYITIVDESFGPDADHKFPSGQKNIARACGSSDKSLDDTARAELFEEPGVSAIDGKNPDSFKFVYGMVSKNGRRNPGYHGKFLCVTDIAQKELAWLYNPAKNPHVEKPLGNEGEVGHFHTPEEFKKLFVVPVGQIDSETGKRRPKFFGPHWDMLESAEKALKSLDLWPL